ncbi:DUF2460 domain-containing protein [Limibaculum sp. FT325]|uniref:DUF2460 domain-containing protein n=1 Tax=Thermohalobaculum sediminis TaxID=2939436 RepID=UPI0020BFFC27|nr:DUF2460 domain-containing protein [Limibaculum sediminis]MCL5775582.1 DUF2460 domain-containing protein [Limibaculum sediminis]
MAFHEVRFPASISFGSSGGIERRTEIVRLVNGHEERNTPWGASRRRYDAGLGVRSLTDLDEVLAFFEARRGMLHGFRWKDWLDHKSCAPGEVPAVSDQVIGKGDGQAQVFQLVKTYEPGPHAFKRAIRKPVAGSVRVAVGGVEAVDGFTLDAATGELVFDAPVAPGATITAGFEFDVPVRFDTDVIEVNLAAFEAGEIPSVPVVELRV